MRNRLFVVACTVLLMSCSSASQYGASRPDAQASSLRVNLGDSTKVKQILSQQYIDWRHVPHKMGGTSKQGIDCSGLVYKTYRAKLGINMPRSTEYQSRVGRVIKKDHLRAGDLVFFKTGVFARHVGMYIDEGNFLHVSSSNGVMISNLEDRYWNRP